jgi:hypothetical protein
LVSVGRRRRKLCETAREREREDRFTEEIGVLESLGGDEEDLQLPVHHVYLLPRSIAGSFLVRCSCSCRERTGRQPSAQESEPTALSPLLLVLATKRAQV